MYRLNPSVLPAEYSGKLYYPGIFLYNKTKCNTDLPPIVAVGTEIINDVVRYDDEHIPGFLVGEDCISAVIINETQANRMDNPLYIVSEILEDFNPAEGQQALNDVVDEIEIMTGNKKTTSSYEDMDIRFTQMDVNHRYENDRKSEIRIVYYYVENGSIRMPQAELDLSKIHKNDIPGTFVCIRELPYIDEYQTRLPIRTNRFYFLLAVTYEYDFGVVNRKEVVVNLLYLPLKCKMRRSNEYYQRVNLEFSDVSWSIGYNKVITDKGSICFTRYPNR